MELAPEETSRAPRCRPPSVLDVLVTTAPLAGDPIGARGPVRRQGPCLLDVAAHRSYRGAVEGRGQRGAATWLLLALTAAVAAVSVVAATRSVLVAAGWLRVDEDDVTRSAVVGVFGEQQVRNAEALVALLSVPVAVTVVALLLGLSTWRGSAREAVLGVCGLSGAGLAVLSAVGLSGGAPDAGRGLAAGLLLLLVAGLAVSPPVVADFDRRRIAREVEERHRRQAERRRREQGRAPYQRPGAAPR